MKIPATTNEPRIYPMVLTCMPTRVYSDPVSSSFTTVGGGGFGAGLKNFKQICRENTVICKSLHMASFEFLDFQLRSFVDPKPFEL